MQMIAEVYGVMRDGLGMTPPQAEAVFKGWNKGPLNSYLIEIAGHVLAAKDPVTGGPLVDLILDKAGQKGTGVWSAIAAQMLGVPATAIEGAVAARSSQLAQGRARRGRGGLRQAGARQGHGFARRPREGRCSRARSSPTRRALR